MARPCPEITADRANRLCKMLFALGDGPQAKDRLVKKLKLEERGFFRDLRLIRDLGISITHHDNQYLLTASLEDALRKLPVPDLKLSLADALDLARGQAPVHKRVRKKLEAFIGSVEQLDRNAPPSYRSTLEG
ncbi:hypothetical protein BH11PLA2_BH11PLA2_31990 [soil metagenome]